VRRLRVLHLTDLYRPVIGGLERHVEGLARAQAQRGHDVAVATLSVRDQPRREVLDGIRIYRLGSLSHRLRLHRDVSQPYHPTVPDPDLMRGLRRVVTNEQPDVVHGHSWLAYSFLPLKAASHAKLVITLHSFSLFCAIQVFVHDGHACSGPAYGKCLGCAAHQYGWPKAAVLTTGLRLSTPLHRQVDAWIAVSSAVAQATTQHAGGLRAPVSVIPNFFSDASLIESGQVERPSFLPQDDGYLLFVGALARHKGFDVLLEAYAGLKQRVPLVAIGMPRPDTPRDIPAGVSVVHNASHTDVMRAWRHSSIAIVPSTCQESFSIVALEAMASGRPVIASAIGGLPEIVSHGETGLLVAPGDATALRTALETLLADGARRERMGQAARQRAARYRSSTVTAEVESVYTALFDNRDGSARSQMASAGGRALAP
jgi:glycosyltransferase involved in cell wall biosynthesis